MDDRIESIRGLLNADQINSDDCQSYMSRSGDSDSSLPLLFVERSALNEAINIFKTNDCQHKEWSNTALMELAAISYSNAIDGPDLTGRLTAYRLLLNICSVPVSSAYGISTATVLCSIAGIASKAAHDILHGMNISEKKRRRGNDDENDTGDDNEYQLQGESSHLARELLGLSGDLLWQVPIFAQRTEVYVLDGIADALVSLMCLGASIAEHAGAGQVAGAALALFSTQNVSCLMAFYRSILPVVTLFGRDSRLPDAPKSKVLCHSAALKVMEAVVGSCGAVQLPTPLSPGATRSPAHIEASPNEADSFEVHPEPHLSSSSQNGPDLNVSFACAVGAIQRVILTAPERIIPRTTLVASVVRLVTAIHSGGDCLDRIYALVKSCGAVGTEKNHANVRLRAGLRDAREDIDEEGEGRRTNVSPNTPCQTGRRESQISQREAATSRLLSFVVKLSRSSKLNIRSLCLDIGSALLSEKWVWASAPLAAENFIRMLVARCADVAATVRSRALGALHDLLETVGSSHNKRGSNACHLLASRLHALIMAASNHREHRLQEDQFPSKSFLDVLRCLVCDEKPLVRAKAIQTYGLVFLIGWPSPDNSQSNPASHLFMSAEDVDILSERCSDQSVAVRKQAAVSLTTLLQDRPLDSLLQEAWIEFVLPLVLDPESSIQSKACQSVYDIVLAGTVMQVGSPASEAVWEICGKIGDLGCTNLLKSAVATMGRQGMLKSASERGKHCITSILGAVKDACCADVLTGGCSEEDVGDVAEDTFLVLSQASECPEDSMKALRSQDPEVKSRGGWVLLEALVSQSSTTFSTNSSISADFVVKCWLTRRAKCKHGAHNKSRVLDELDTRMLVVMSKVYDAVQNPLKIKVCSELFPILTSPTMHFEPAAASAAINVMFLYSIGETRGDSESHLSSRIVFSENSSYESVLIFGGRVLNTINYVLRKYLWPTADGEPLFTSPRLPLHTVGMDHPPASTSVTNALYMLGELAMLGFSVEEDEDHYKTKGSVSDQSDGLPSYSVSEASGTFRFNIPEEVVVMVQILMGHVTPGSNDGNISLPTFDQSTINASGIVDDSVLSSGVYSGARQIPSVVRAQAFVTMGKLCLRSKVRARNHVNIFLRELKAISPAHIRSMNGLNENSVSAISDNTSGGSATHELGMHAVRSNSLIVLGDLCVRFTNLVDRHVGSMAACLQDPSDLVRRHSFVLLTQLLLQDYIKWRGMMLFRFLATILDKNEEMAELARYVLKSTLQTKFSGYMVQNFAESIIVFNGCTDHATYQAMASIGSDGGSCAVSMEGIELAGSGMRSQRMRVYEFMMEDISEEQKIQVTANIAQDIFAYALDFPQSSSRVGRPDGGEAFTPFENALVDSFLILKSPLLRVGSRRGNGGVDDEEEEEIEGGTGEGASAKAAFQKAKTKVLKKLSVQHMVDHILPVVSSLKHMLEGKKSPAQRALMEYLVYLVNANKAEVAQALSSDPTLKEEIEYDIKLFERDRLAEKKRREIASAEKAVISLEISTARKSSCNSATSRSRTGRDSLVTRDYTSGECADNRLAVSGTRGSSDKARRTSRGTPMLKPLSANIKKSLAAVQSAPGITNVRIGASTTRVANCGTDVDDFSTRLMTGASPVASPNSLAGDAVSTVSSRRRWSVSIGDLDISSENSIGAANVERNDSDLRQRSCIRKVGNSALQDETDVISTLGDNPPKRLKSSDVVCRDTLEICPTDTSGGNTNAKTDSLSSLVTKIDSSFPIGCKRTTTRGKRGKTRDVLSSLK